MNLGLVDTPQAAEAAGHAVRQADIDLLFRYYVTTYAVSSTVLPGLPDRAAVTAEWLAYCSACPVPEIANVMSRARIPFHQVTGVGSRLEKLAKLLGIDVVRIC